MKTTSNPAMLLLAIWLILLGVRDTLNVSFEGFGLILGLLALAAGVLILVGK